MRRVNTEESLLVAGALSLTAHLALGAWLAGAFVTQRKFADDITVNVISMADLAPAIQEPEPPSPEVPIQLGLEDSEAQSRAWLGLTEITDLQQATNGDFEQAAMSPEAGEDVESESSFEWASASASPMAVERPAASEPTIDSGSIPHFEDQPLLPPMLGQWPLIDEVMPELASAGPMETADSIETPELGEPLQVLDQAVDKVVEQAAPRPTTAEKISPQPDSPATTEASESTPTTPEPVKSAQGSPTQTGQAPGVNSGKESPASSLDEPITWRANGQVLAAKGLEITPKAPKFDFVTRATQQPRDPVVRIKFGRDGRVKKAWFVRDGARVLNSGTLLVDEPLMHAIYRWRAKGERLTKLSASDPEAGLIVTVKIAL
jgi:hypothetical protein